MKILFLSDVDYFKGGAERSLFDAMATPGITPILAAPGEGPLLQAARDKAIQTQNIEFGRVLTVRRPFKFRDILRTFKDALTAARQLKATDASAIHSNGLKAHGVACLARLIGGPKVIIHYRSIPHTPQEKIFWKATQIIAHKVILVSRPCWPGRNLPRNVEVIFNGIEIPDRSILPNRPPTPRPFTLGFIARIHPSKGLDTLITWMAYAKEKGLDIALIIRGEAAPDEPAYEARCRQMVADKNLEEIITFEGRKESYQEIYAGLDVNVVSSVTPDPLPRSCMEACAFGIPVLGYPAGGLPYMIEDGLNGFLIKDEHAFNTALKHLMEEEGLYEKISAAAIQNAKDNFSLAALHAALSKIYQTL